MKLKIIRFFKRNKIASSLLSLTIYGVILSSVFWWQHKDMLSISDSVSIDELALIDINGEVYRHKFDNGTDDTLIYFFAPWCSICHASIDNIEDIKNSEYKGLKILIVALDWHAIEEVDDFLQKHELTVPVLLGTKDTQRSFQISAFPSYYLISKNGTIKARNKGYTTELGMKISLNLNR